MLTVAPHPLLDARALLAHHPAPLGALDTPAEWVALMSASAEAPMHSSESVRAAIRDLLRHGGFKPTGRNKPASEYLVRAAGEGRLGAINPAVDLGNVVSLHSGLPISVVDWDRLEEPARIAIAEPGSSYVFNRSGQVIDVGGLLCLMDAHGPCANAVKDAQRTKTDEQTTTTLTILWGSVALAGLSDRALAWYQELAATSGARIERLL